MAQGFSESQARYLAEPYVGMGEHFAPRRWGLPEWFTESRFNVLKPRDISRGRFYELHYKVDYKFHGTRLPKRVGGGSWSGKSIGLTKYGGWEKLWHGSPTEFKLTLGATIAGGGTAAGAYFIDE
jgi:hypothetical protein